MATSRRWKLSCLTSIESVQPPSWCAPATSLVTGQTPRPVLPAFASGKRFVSWGITKRWCLVVVTSHDACTPASGFRQVSGLADHDLDRTPPCIINPGAVGQSRDTEPLARYAVLDLEGQTVSFRELPYEHLATIRKLRRAGLVARVVLLPPRGLWRRVEAYRARCARYWAARRSETEG